MCLGVPALVLGPADGPEGLVRVDVQGEERTANALMLDEPPAPGEWVVLHLGFAVERIDEAAALDALDVLRTLGGTQAGVSALDPGPGAGDEIVGRDRLGRAGEAL